MTHADASASKNRIEAELFVWSEVCGAGIVTDPDGGGYAVGVFLRVEAADVRAAIRKRYPEITFVFRVVGEPHAS